MRAAPCFRGCMVKVPAAYIGADAHAAGLGDERPHGSEHFALALDAGVQKFLSVVENKRNAFAAGSGTHAQEFFPVVVEIA